MFIISLTYKKPIDEVEKHIPEHIVFLDRFYAKNNFVFSGRKNPRTGGIILASNVSNNEINEIIKEDPFFQHGIADYEITEFIPTKFDKRFDASFIDSFK
jgi:uncharacterized protein YciI